jgi:hypothetical protein
MPNDFPTFPGVLAEATAFSLNDLALMSPEEMTPAAELAYIEELRAYRERYERALGAKPTRGATKGAKGAVGPTAKVILDGAYGAETGDVEF